MLVRRWIYWVIARDNLMKTATELVDWVYDLWVQMIIPDEIDQPGRLASDSDGDGDGE